MRFTDGVMTAAITLLALAALISIIHVMQTP